MFTKNQPITLFINRNNKGSVQVHDLIIYSCGKKQMVLVNEAGEKFTGANWRPQEEQSSFHRVTPRKTVEEADAYATSLAQHIVASEKARMENCISHYGYPEEHGYTRTVRKNIADLHEPRVTRA